MRLLHPTFEPGLSSSYPSDRPTLWIDSPALMACLDSLEASPAPLPDFETAAPTPLADILPAREPDDHSPCREGTRVPTAASPPMPLTGSRRWTWTATACEIVNSSDFPAISTSAAASSTASTSRASSPPRGRRAELVGLHIRRSRQPFAPLLRLVCGRRPGDGVNFTRYLYFDGESLLLYKPDRSHTDHIADATLADPSVPAEVAARAKQLVR